MLNLDAQISWPTESVALSEHFSASFLNPAGLGVDRGTEISVNFIGDSLNELEYSVIGFRGNGSGAYFQKNLLNQNKIFGVANGTYVGNGHYTGFSWENTKDIQFGYLFRPSSYFSLGLTGKMNYGTKGQTFASAGLGVRPFGSSFLTIAGDVQYDIHNATVLAMPIVMDVSFNDKLNLNIAYDSKKETISAGVQFSFGKMKPSVYQIRKPSHTNFVAGLTYVSKAPRQKNDFNFGKKSDPNQWVFLSLEGLVIEEPVKKREIFEDFTDELMPSFGGLFSQTPHVIQLRTWIARMETLANDPSITGIIIRPGNLQAGFGKRQEMIDAFKKFKNAGKKIIVYTTTGIGNIDYMFYAFADEIYMPSMANVDLRGLAIEIDYYKTLMDSLGIIGEFEQISPYKSAADQFLRQDMSDEVKENYSTLFGDIYKQFASTIAEGRGWSFEKTNAIINDGPYLATDALQAGLISGFKYPDEFTTFIDSLTGKPFSKMMHFSNQDVEESFVDDWKPSENNTAIAVIYAVGSIVSGNSKRGATGSKTMGDRTIRNAIKQARENDAVKAIVLRIDSGGGSALASDLMWKEVLNTTDSSNTNHKPLIASMSDVAASGGYYIACQADKIVADPGTITGSIGVLGGRINFSGLKRKIGISNDRLTFGKHSDMYSNGRLWTTEERSQMRDQIVSIYGVFLNRVAQGRDGLDSLGVDAVGLGRVWSGERAKTLNLVDEVGGLTKAIQVAKELAQIPVDCDVQIIEYPNRDKFMKKNNPFNKTVLETELVQRIAPELNQFSDVISVMSDEKHYFILPFQKRVQ